MSSSQEVVFQTNVIVRQIVDYLIEGPVDLLALALVNRKFYEETNSRLRQIRHIELYRIQPKVVDDGSLDETQPEDEAEYERSLQIQYGISQIICESPSIFKSNLTFVAKQSAITSMDFRQLNGCDDIGLDSLLQITGKL